MVVTLRVCRFFSITALTSLLGLAVGCGPSAEERAQVVSRMLPKALFSIAHLVHTDTTCGFASDASVVTTVDNETESGTSERLVPLCNLIVDKHVVMEGCDALTVTGTLSIRGERFRATGESGWQYRLVIFTEDLRIVDDGFDMTLVRGRYEVRMTPELYREEGGQCEFLSPHISFDQISITDGGILIPDEDINIDVTYSDLSANWGSPSDGENSVSGELSVLGQSVTFASSEAPEVLHPDYERDAFDEQFSCAEMLATPVDRCQ